MSKADEVLAKIRDLRTIANAMEDNKIRGQVKLKYSTADGEGDFEFVGICDSSYHTSPNYSAASVTAAPKDRYVERDTDA